MWRQEEDTKQQLHHTRVNDNMEVKDAAAGLEQKSCLVQILVVNLMSNCYQIRQYYQNLFPSKVYKV